MSEVMPRKSLSPYPAYKPSGVEWLGDVPAHWEVRRLKQLCSQSALYGANIAAAQYQEDGVRFLRTTDITDEGHLRPGGVFLSEDRVLDYLLKDRDLLISRSGTVGRSFLYQSKLHGPCAYAGYLVRFVTNELVLSEYVFQFTRTQAFDNFLRIMAISSTIENVNADKYANAHLTLPPLPEQRAIVRYLDYVGRRIRRYITAKRKLIALLEEEKQAVINQAVTRGLDSNVRLKPSGVEWLGDVPEHWEVGPLKRAFLSLDYGISESASDSGNIRLLTMGHLKDGQIMVPNDGGVDSVAPHLLLEKGDLLFNRTNSQELVGKVGLFVGYDSPVTFASYLVRMRPQPSHEPEYLNVALNDFSFISRARREAIPSLHQSNLNPTRYGRIHIALPPWEEQGVILRMLRKETARLRDAIARARRQVNLLEEYRTSLIADVVTGKLDVREAAAHLPDESDDQNLIQGTDSSTHDSDEDFYAANNSEDKVPIEAPI